MSVLVAKEAGNVVKDTVNKVTKDKPFGGKAAIHDSKSKGADPANDNTLDLVRKVA